MNLKQKIHCSVAQAAFVVVGLLSASVPAIAQDSNKPVAEKWRPKDGTYLGATTDPKYDRCRDFGDLAIELSEKIMGGHEQECKITKLTDTVPGTIRLDVICTALEQKKPHRDIVILKKIDDKTILYRPATDGKFKYPGERMSYCPEEAQRLFTDSKKNR